MPATRPVRRLYRLTRPRVRASVLPRERRIETLRGVACLLLVTFHAVGSSSSSGLHVPDGSPYREFTNLFVHIRMPLFTFLSGLVYAYRPLLTGDAWGFAGKKLRRLAVPMVVAATILYGLHLALHHQVPPPSRMWSIYVYPFWHLWFVQALIVVFAALVVLELLGALATFGRYVAVMAAALVLYRYGTLLSSELVGMRNATYLLPFFLWGLGVHRFREVLQSPGALLVAAACFVVAQGFHSVLVLGHTLSPIDPVATRTGWTLVIGMSAGLSGLMLVPRVPLLERIGGSSYPIYLYHPIFVAGVLSGVGALDALPTSLLFLCAAVAGVSGPMVMELVAARVPLAGLLLEGKWGRGARAGPEHAERGEARRAA